MNTRISITGYPVSLRRGRSAVMHRRTRRVGAALPAGVVPRKVGPGKGMARGRAGERAATANAGGGARGAAV